MLYWVRASNLNSFFYAFKDTTLLGYDRTICPQCNRTIARPQYISGIPALLLDGGYEYPDCLGFCGAGRQLFLVSEKTLNLFERYQISGYTEYHLTGVECVNPDRSKLHMPNYYALSISGKIDLDAAEMHIKKKKYCASCNQFEWSRMRLEPIVLNQTTWDGSDLCLLSSIPGLKVCSERTKELAKCHNLTGFSFKVAL